MTARLLAALAAAPPGVERALELAWDAYCHGSLPVGAVVLDGRQEVVFEGRNAAADVGFDMRGVRGTSLAHAEMEALVALGRPRKGLRLLSTLEPCPMCAAAALLQRIEDVHYLAPDPFLGMRTFPALADRFEHRGRAVSHIPAGGLDVLAGALPLEFMHRAGGYAEVIDAWPSRTESGALARRLFTKGRLADAARHRLPLVDVVGIADRVLAS